MNCPGCQERCNINLENKYYCKKCGAVEKASPNGEGGNMWIRDGRVIAVDKFE